MGLWILLLPLHLVFAVSLSPPSNVSISSFNMEHTLHFLPGPGTPSDTHFTVQVVHHRKNMWGPVVGCSKLTAGQMCSMTRVFTDPYTHYKARVQAFTTTQTSSWTVSAWFQPLSDTVLGPPEVSVSGCGNCLSLRLKPPVTKGLQNLQLEKLYREVILHVRRSRDGSQFLLKLPYSEEKVIMYLQPGVEYCVSISVTAFFNSNPVSSEPHCAFTSPPTSKSSPYLVIGVLGVFCILGFLVIGLVVNGGQRRFKIMRRRLSSSLSCTNTSRRALRSSCDGERTGPVDQVDWF